MSGSSAGSIVTVTEARDTTRIEVRDPRGIGRATIERGGSWPEVLVLRLHLKGLESLELAAGGDTVRASRPTSDGPPTDGWYQVPVPASLLVGQRTLQVSWIDFHRR